ncbi:MAG: DUF4037 domain-containing protein [Rhodocyclaceae bacterium]
MHGLALSRSYYDTHKDALLAPFAAYRPRIAAGLVGMGSECFGFDDALSRDHDFGPGFCLWLNAADHAAIGAPLQAAYDALPPGHAGFGARRTNSRSGQRVGVFGIADFYTRFLGAPQLPISDADWLQIPEELLATAVNGEVFSDPLGEFSAIRQRLLAYYPEGVRRLKLATAVAKMAQSGQYNLPRAVARNASVTALLAQAEFARHACLAAYALNARYAPFYKWLHRGVANLPRLASLHDKLDRLARLPTTQAAALVEEICADVLIELVAQGFTVPGDAFLETHVDAILGRTQEHHR